MASDFDHMASDLGLHCLLQTVCPIPRVQTVFYNIYLLHVIGYLIWVYMSSSVLSAQDLGYVRYSTVSIC